MNNVQDVKDATRQELVTYLISWGSTFIGGCAGKSTSLLRSAAICLARHRAYIAQRRHELRNDSINTY